MNKAEQTLKAVALGVRRDLDDAARVLLQADADSVAEHVATLDRTLRKAFDTLDECARFCEVHRPSAPREYDPVRLVRDEVGHFERAEDSLAPDEPEAYWGDPEQLRLCLRLIVRMFAKQRIAFTIRLYLETQEPRIEITSDQAAPLPSKLTLGECFVLSGDEFGHVWTAATDGGEACLSDGSFILYLAGDRTRAMIQTVGELVRTSLVQAARTLSAWRGAIGQYETGLVSLEDTLGLYRRSVSEAIVLVDRALEALA